jgi:hypothetical protein
MSDSINVKLLKAKHGLVGYAVYLRLLEIGYAENGYFVNADDRMLLLFANDEHIELDQLHSILETMFDEDLFDRKLFDSYKILTSNRMQRNFLKACKRRNKVEIDERYILIDTNDSRLEGVCNNLVIVNNNSVNVCNNSVNVNINPTKERKVKESKEKKRGRSASSADTQDKNSINDLIINLFQQAYKSNRGYKYEPESRGKERRNANRLFKLIEDRHETELAKLPRGQPKLDYIFKKAEQWFQMVTSITDAEDRFVYKALTLTYACTKINELKVILEKRKNGRQQNKRTIRSEAELQSIIENF